MTEQTHSNPYQEAEKTSIIAELNAEHILGWIQQNPTFLVHYAEQLGAIQPEATNITPLHVARAKRAEKSHEAIEKTQQRLVRTVEANTQSANTLFLVIPELVRCTTLAQLRKFIQTDLKKALDLDASRLVLSGAEESSSTQTAEAIQSYFEEGSVVLRTLYDVDERAPYGTTGKTLKSDALFHMTNKEGQTLGMLMLASKSEQRFHPGQGQELVRFFGNVLNSVMENIDRAES